MNTRFNPTVNGRLHVGHAYVALLNYHAAKSTGGRFVVRFDDDQTHWRRIVGDEMTRVYSECVKDDLEWLGVVVDSYTSERESREMNEEFVVGMLPHPEWTLRNRGNEELLYAPSVKSCPAPYPYAPYLTAVKVAQDFRERIDVLIRGDDLATECSLYCYFCDVANIPRPAFYYVPRMVKRVGMGGMTTDLADVSKTEGSNKISDYREAGWKPEDVVAMIAESALIDPASGWTYENVLKCPVLRRMP